MKHAMRYCNTSFRYKIGWVCWPLRTRGPCLSPVICILTLLKLILILWAPFYIEHSWLIFSNVMFLHQQKQTPDPPKTVIRKTWCSLHEWGTLMFDQCLAFILWWRLSATHGDSLLWSLLLARGSVGDRDQPLKKSHLATQKPSFSLIFIIRSCSKGFIKNWEQNVSIFHMWKNSLHGQRSS